MRNHVINIILLLFLFFGYTFLFNRQVFGFKFDSRLINKYFHSQDIPHEVPGRLFLSDSEIHIVSGYLYTKGYDPSIINFQHPPLIKYFFGLSTVFLKNPLIVQVVLAVLLIFLTYSLGVIAFKSKIIGVIGAVLLLFDPVLHSLISLALLDLGQAVFITVFIVLSIVKKPNPYFTGVAIGLASGSKFWAGSAFFYVIVVFFLFQSKLLSKKFFLKQIISAGATFCLIYVPSFIYQKGLFNIIFFELKTLKYWLNHSVSSMFGASLVMFSSGFYKSWWGDKNWERSLNWSLIYPITFCLSALSLVHIIRSKKVSLPSLLNTIPILYLLYLGVQAPYDRYFIVILPYCYLILSSLIVKKLRI